MDMNAAIMDYAKFGRLYLNDGNWNGRQITMIRKSVQWLTNLSIMKDIIAVTGGGAEMRTAVPTITQSGCTVNTSISALIRT